MKVYLSSDMEGTAGIVDWDQCTAEGRDYARFVSLLTDEINAAIEGAVEGGATEFVVNDSHSAMHNLDPRALSSGARLISGRYKPMYMMEGLDSSFDAVFLVSYHGSMGAERAVLSHTYSSRAIAEVWIDDRIAGEAAINALVASAYGVPIVLVTGDQTTEIETRPFCPDARFAVVKDSISRFAANSLHPSEACALIRREARLAVEGAASARQRDFSTHTTITVRFTTADYADLADRIVGVERVDALHARISGTDPLELYRTFLTVVYLTRGLAS